MRPRNQRVALLATMFSVLSTTNAQWVEVGLSNWTVTALAAGPVSPGSISSVIYAGTRLDGVYRSTDDGETWAATNKFPLNETIRRISQSNAKGGPRLEPFVWSLAVNGNSLFASMRLAGVFRSTDKGETWVAVNNGLKGKQDLAVLGPEEVERLVADNEFVFATTPTGAVFLSMDNGKNWMQANNGLPIGERYYRITALTVFPNSGRSVVLAAIPESGVYRSTDDGKQWSDITTNLPTKMISAFAACPGPTGTDYLLAGSDAGRVFLSSDNGISWTSLKTGLPAHVKFLSFAVRGSNIFAGTNGNVYLSTNNALTWTPVRTGMPSLGINSLTLSGNYLYAMVKGGRIWRRSISEMVAEAQSQPK